jgi:plastocyanin
MKRLQTAVGALWCGASLFAGATVEGVVELPVESKGPASSGRYQIKASSPVGKPDPIQAVVYLEGDFPKAAATGTVEVAQKHFQFARGITPVQKGMRVEFPNYDDDFHNVFSYSKVKRFDLGRYRKDEKPPPSQVFDKPGVIKLFCEIHEHMRGTILVLDTPHFDTTDANGKYRLENLPPGKHTLKVWVNDKVIERPVELKEGETTKVDFK